MRRVLLFVYKNVTFFSYVDKKTINGTVITSSVLMNEEKPIKKWFELVREYLWHFVVKQMYTYCNLEHVSLFRLYVLEANTYLWKYELLRFTAFQF
jgi:hypothetical protein